MPNGSFINFKKEISIRIADPRIVLNEIFGYLSSMGLITAIFVLLGMDSIVILQTKFYYSLRSSNIPLLMVYIPQRIFLTTGILGIIITNYFATNPIGNSLEKGYLGMIKVDYSYEALVKYHPDEYESESQLLGGSVS